MQLMPKPRRDEHEFQGMSFESSADPLPLTIVPNFDESEDSVLFEPTDFVSDTLHNRVMGGRG
jgi:hypothetical protein